MFANRRKFFAILKFVISAMLIALLVRQVGVGQLWVDIRRVEVTLLLWALLMQIPLVIFSAYRWHLLLEGQGLRFALHKVLCCYMIGYFFNAFLPTSIGGDVVRAGLLSRSGGQAGTVTASVVVDRLVGLFSMIMVGSLSLLIGAALGPPWTYRWRVILIMLVFAGLMVSGFWGSAGLRRISPGYGKGTSMLGRLVGVWSHFIGAIRVYRHARGLLVKALAVSALSQLLVGAIAWLTAKAVALNVSLLTLVGIVAAVTLLTILPVSINGVGVQDAGYVVMLQPLGISMSVALLFSVVWHSQRYAHALVGGIVYGLGLYDGNPTGDPSSIP